MMDTLEALVTCDDGWEAVGFHALLRAIRKSFKRIKSSVPMTGCPSLGTATGSTEVKTLAVRTRVLEGLPVHVLDSLPATAVQHLLASGTGAGQMLFSGVNHGPNVGRAVLHSGTFAAGLIGSLHGIPSVCVSLDDVYSVDEANPGTLQYELAAHLAVATGQWLRQQRRALLCNVNVPNLKSEDVEAVTACVLDGQRVSDSACDEDVRALQRGEVSVSVFPELSLRVCPQLSTDAALSVSCAIH